MDNAMSVRAVASPFGVGATDFSFPEGLSLGEMVRKIQPDPVLRKYGRIFIGDMMISWDKIDRVYPKPGNPITIRMLPAGGSGSGGKKNPLRTILSIAVIAAAAWAGPAMAGLGGNLGLGATGIKIASALGSAAISAVGPLNAMTMLPVGEYS